MGVGGAGTDAAILARGLTKDYGKGRGLFDLDLGVQPGEVFGYVGPNGAGKTTTIRLLMDLVRPDRGEVSVFGLDCQGRSTEVKRITGFVPGEQPQLGGATGSEIVELLGHLRGGVDRRHTHELAERLDLDLRLRYRDLSHGNKQKLLLVQAFMHRPRLLVLDEPTLGLDPVVQLEFRRLVRERATEGAAVFLSSHVLSEVERDCDRIGVLFEGRLRDVGSLTELRGLSAHQITAVLERDFDPSALQRLEEVSSVELVDHQLQCRVHGRMGALIAALEPAGIIELDSQEMSLEDIFFTEYARPEGS